MLPVLAIIAAAVTASAVQRAGAAVAKVGGAALGKLGIKTGLAGKSALGILKGEFVAGMNLLQGAFASIIGGLQFIGAYILKGVGLTSAAAGYFPPLLVMVDSLRLYG